MDQETLTEMVKPSIDYMRHKRFRSGNYPSSLSNETDRLVHWCHGAPGVNHELMQAHKVSAQAVSLASSVHTHTAHHRVFRLVLIITFACKLKTF